MKNYGIFKNPIVTIYDADYTVTQTPEGERSTISDEGLYGHTCKIVAGPGGMNTKGLPLAENMVELVTAYGYHGYAYATDVSMASEAKLRSMLHGKFVLVTREADVLNAPTVQGIRLLTLVRGCVIECMPERTAEDSTSALPLAVAGWQRVRLLDGQIGYLRSTSVKAKVFSRATVFYLDEAHTFNEAMAKTRGIAETDIVSYTVQRYFGGDEMRLREKIIETALAYLGSQYRWGGKTPAGIDCSGLVSMAYLQNGISIYRDAKIVEGWPVKEIDRAHLKPADLIYFPGHVALYLGQGHYLHSTAFAESGGVVVNSFLPGNSLFRQDLFDTITVCGSVFERVLE